MAIYRNIHISFWTDPFVLELTPEQKYFYLYLMTNSKTTQCGIYELPKTIVQFETEYNLETVDKLLRFFIDNQKIICDEKTKEVMINDVRVTEMPYTSGDFGAIIGMNIITLEDFAITNTNNRTVCSFRIPSISTIDFVEEHRRIHGGGNKLRKKR